MKKMSTGTYEGVKTLSEALVESTTWFDEKPHLTEKELDALEWAKEFMDRYEYRNRNKIERGGYEKQRLANAGRLLPSERSPRES